jgi:hypothetical protein
MFPPMKLLVFPAAVEGLVTAGASLVGLINKKTISDLTYFKAFQM